ncbi:hypothetical protein CDAR_247351 [Caerostris darwini]|uniref:Uncharacterized protein n=1 Tax=Caerostris darwini TaxID=1538125 RepID=A0AAV4MF93_9ARAC|nr:hypothetical protein CDAR_247351 [Caerostris darwini]
MLQYLLKLSTPSNQPRQRGKPVKRLKGQDLLKNPFQHRTLTKAPLMYGTGFSITSQKVLRKLTTYGLPRPYVSPLPILMDSGPCNDIGSSYVDFFLGRGEKALILDADAFVLHNLRGICPAVRGIKFSPFFFYFRNLFSFP